VYPKNHQVTGGADKGGILVREGQGLSSKDRLVVESGWEISGGEIRGVAGKRLK